MIEALGIDREIFPEIQDSCTVRGELTAGMAGAMGVRSGTPVAIPSGDHQCSFIGAVEDAESTVAINIGTGGQATVYLEDLSCLLRNPDDGTYDHGWLELSDHILNVVIFWQALAWWVAARFRTLKDFFVRTAGTVFDVEDVDEDKVYERLAQLAGDAMYDESAEKLKASALFTGSRERPDARGEFSNITPGNFTPGSMALAVFRSMASELANSYHSAVELGAGPKDRVVGSGNGLRLNAALRRGVEQAFGRTISIGRVREEAAVGAALTGAVAVGVYSDIGSAGRALER